MRFVLKEKKSLLAWTSNGAYIVKIGGYQHIDKAVLQDFEHNFMERFFSFLNSVFDAYGSANRSCSEDDRDGWFYLRIVPDSIKKAPEKTIVVNPKLAKLIFLPYN